MQHNGSISSTLQSDYRSGHKQRQRVRKQQRKKDAVKALIARLPPFRELPLVINTNSNTADDNDNGNSTTNKKKQLSDIYQSISRLDVDTTNDFWAKVPIICNPKTAVLEERISDEYELLIDLSRSEKYRRKLQIKMERGHITQIEVDDLWKKHGKRTTNTIANTNIGTNTDTDKKNDNTKAKIKNATTTTAMISNDAVSLLSNDRGQRKAWQVENFVSLLRERLSSSDTTILRVVDFGCGSGNLCLALAPYFPQVRFVLVDKKPYSLKLAARRAKDAGLKNVQVMQYSFSPSNLDNFRIPSMPLSMPLSSSSATEFTICMPVTTRSTSSPPSSEQLIENDFDIAIGLHCCGSFTDMVMSIAKSRGADCIVCPCCNGAMTSKTTCGYKYPRSVFLGKLINQDEYLSLLSRAADDLGSYEAKCLIEYDRALWAYENGYDVQLLKLSPKECTPKHHVLYLTRR